MITNIIDCSFLTAGLFFKDNYSFFLRLQIQNKSTMQDSGKHLVSNNISLDIDFSHSQFYSAPQIHKLKGFGFLFQRQKSARTKICFWGRMLPLHWVALLICIQKSLSQVIHSSPNSRRGRGVAIMMQHINPKGDKHQISG